MTSWARPINMMGNMLDSIQHDPQASQIMLGVGLAHDLVKHAPVDLFANIPHFESEIEGSTSGRSNSAGSPAGTAL